MSLVPNRNRWIQSSLALALVALLLPCLPLAAGQKKKAHTVRKSRVHHRRRYRRYLHVRIQSARVKEIQQALVKAGFLHDRPDGMWGSSTREAMKQFQKRNGFTPTGLPEAKPLMLLGLGPHPLPPGLGPLPSTKPVGDSESSDETEASVASTSPRPTKPTSSN